MAFNVRKRWREREKNLVEEKKNEKTKFVARIDGNCGVDRRKWTEKIESGKEFFFDEKTKTYTYFW